MKLQNLRKKYPEFVYEDYSYKISKNNLEILFNFTIKPGIHFEPKIIIENIDKTKIKRAGDRVLNNLVFHLGLMEIPSYWKATCSPKIIIKAGALDKTQINWWKDLIEKGMGQFFYENKIDFTRLNFLKIISQKPEQSSRRTNLRELDERVLVPVGGGRDSIVTIEGLKKRGREINGFVVNPTKAAKNVLKVAGIKKPIVVQRKIDPTLLNLNKKGFLNGHTPFTALLSFLAVFCAVLFNYKNIAFSNEKSANEGNVKYLGRIINHQYSKSSDFERKFKLYCKKYLVKNINYFSFLRQYTELEISKMFTKYRKYFPVFSSCNVSSKTGKRWCQNCPKCLFVYSALYPFLKKEELFKIFSKDLFEDKTLLPIMRSLMGQGKLKPFECVGTYKESRLALGLSLIKSRQKGKTPFLLAEYEKMR